jgi:general secretion pathway protein G
MLLTLLAPILVTPLMQTPAPAQVTPESFIPANSLVVVRVRSVDAAMRALQPFLPDGAMGGMSNPLDVLKLATQLDVPVDQVDGAAPIILTAQPSETHPPTETTLIVTCKDPVAFAAPFTKAGWTCTTAGKIVACSQSKPGPVLAADSPLRIGLDREDVVVRVAMEEVMAQFGGMVHGTLDQIAQAAEMGAEEDQSNAAATGMLDGIGNAIDAIEMLEAGLSRRGDEMRMKLEMTVLEDTDLANVEKVDASGLAEVARLLDPDSTISFLAAFDYAKVVKHLQGFMDRMAAEMPEAERAQFEAMMKASSELYATMGPTMGVSAVIDGSGLHGTGLIRPKDPSVYVSKMAELTKVGAGWMQITGPEKSQVEGTDVSTFHFKFDPAAMPQAAGQDEELKAAAQAATSKVMDAMFGPDGMTMSLAPKNGALVMTFGGPGEIKKAFARMSSKTPNPFGDSMLQALGGMNPGFVYHIDIGRLFGAAAELADKAGAPPGTMATPQVAVMRELPPVTLAAGVEGRAWRLVLSTDGAKLVTAIARIRAMEPKLPEADQIPPRERAKEDITEIMDALHAFALNNKGNYPDSLEPLVTPDMNGVRYLDRKSAPIDPWGHAYIYTPPGKDHPEPRVATLGADGKVGGEGDDEDMDNESIDEDDR